MKKFILSAIVSLISLTISFSQGKYGGIEIGGKGIKVSIVNVKNVETGEFEIIKFWTRNTAITRCVSSKNILCSDDINETANAVKEIKGQLENEYQLADDRIFIVASSGVALAQNKQDLVDKISSLINRKIDFITSEMEGKLVTKGAIPPSKYTNSFIFDIGGGNSKGGYVSIDDGNHYVFTPLAFELGSVTLTERIKRNSKGSDFNDYLASASLFNDSLKSVVKFVYDNKPEVRIKKNVYLIGGAPWAFISLTRPNSSKPFDEFNYQDIKNYQYDIINNFGSIQEKADTNATMQKALNTYSRESLLSGANIMLMAVGDLREPDKKKLYFVRQGHVAWLIAYIVDTVRKNNK